MRKIRTAALCGLVLSLAAGAALAQGAAPAAPLLVMTTSSFTDGGVLAPKYTGASEKPASPELSWSNAPAATVSFTLLVHDLDTAPTKSSLDNTHWLIFNIPGTAKGLPEGVANTATLPDGSVQIKSVPTAPFGFRGPGFRGPGYHHYAFELYALDTKLTATSDTPRVDIIKAMDGHVIGRAALVAQGNSLKAN